MQEEAFKRAQCSLEGLSVGDAFGERFFFVPPEVVMSSVEVRILPIPPWHYTDDTNMALSIVSILRQYGKIDQDALALNFAEYYDPSRGYGMGMHRLLGQLQQGKSWKEESKNLFFNQGSFGNGAAMRVAPLGGYFAHNLDQVVEQARLSAEVTHAHPEGIAGAIGVAIAAALALELRGYDPAPNPQAFLDQVLPFIPESEVQTGVRQARDLPPGTTVMDAVKALGNGSAISAQDTVPFALWCAAQSLDNYEEALWLTVSGLGDRDTNCSIVGGIVALYTGPEGIPSQWRNNRESLPDWPFQDN
jgi:ADP-ribosylglycohydrolase